jgi:hypothetical protein
MALVLKDRVKETTTTTSTGTYTLAGAVTGFQSFAVVGNGNSTYYTVTDGTNWEVGVGTYTSSGTLLSRDTILESSNGGSAVNWGAGSKDVFLTYPAERAVLVDNNSEIVPATSASLVGNTTTIQLRYSSTPGAVPTSGSLFSGELVVNTADGKLYFLDSLNAVQVLAQINQATTNGVETLTNKRITQRCNAQTTTASPFAWNSDSYDQQSFSALANALTINADAGTPTDGQRAIFRIKDNGVARALTWTTGVSKGFRAVGVTLPTTTVINKTVYVGCIYNIADSRWDAVAVAQEA